MTHIGVFQHTYPLAGRISSYVVLAIEILFSPLILAKRVKYNIIKTHIKSFVFLNKAQETSVM